MTPDVRLNIRQTFPAQTDTFLMDFIHQMNNGAKALPSDALCPFQYCHNLVQKRSVSVGIFFRLRFLNFAQFIAHSVQYATEASLFRKLVIISALLIDQFLAYGFGCYSGISKDIL